MLTIATAARNIANALTAAGADVQTFGSGLSDSQYVRAVHAGRTATIRISDHDLPPAHQGERGEDFRTEVVLFAILGGNWLDAAVDTIQALGLTLPAYLRRLVTIRQRERRAVVEQAEQDQADRVAYQQEVESKAAELASRLSDEDRAKAIAIDASGERGQVRRRRLGRIAARYSATPGLIRRAITL
ncbi:MAG: hypothetical protein PHX05_08280 [Acidobacteriota bacterium]|nr:hypothetical protein [Acidobacteriota bacterium]